MIRSTLFLLLLSLTMAPLSAQENRYLEDYLERLEQSKAYLLEVASLMPAEFYDFRASPESKSFAENLMHIAWAMDWHSQSLLGGREARDWRTDFTLQVASKTKKEMIATLSKTFEATITLLQQLDSDQLDHELDYFGLTRSKRQICMLLSDHITHHRAQLLVSLRLKGLTPPRYVLYQ